MGGIRLELPLLIWVDFGMPWVPELFTAPALQRLLDKRRREELVAVTYFYGLMAGEPDALIESFAGEPELQDRVRGRVKGVRAFEAFVTEMYAWFTQHNALVEEVEHVILERRGFEEVVLHLEVDTGPVDLPVAIVADHPSGGLINELRIYYSSWPLTGRHANRPPLLQPDPELRQSDAVADYQCALTAGDVEAIVAAFEAGGYARAREQAAQSPRPRGPAHFRRADVRERRWHPAELCALIDDRRACALEYNVVRWGET